VKIGEKVTNSEQETFAGRKTAGGFLEKECKIVKDITKTSEKWVCYAEYG